MVYHWTGQNRCYDAAGREIACQGTGQDGASRCGTPWPEPRFDTAGEVVTDRLTALMWRRSADAAGPLSWDEAFAYLGEMNRVRASGYGDWRLPNRRELRSLISHQTRSPALPAGHPFRDVFPSWYWSSTTAVISPAHAWYVDMAGGRMFYGGKDQSFLVWPVRGGNGRLAATGQTRCYDTVGQVIGCPCSGQDGALRYGRPWPAPRFLVQGEGILDRLTDLEWRRDADLTGTAVTWDEALAAVEALNTGENSRPWRLPNINELESLVDCDRHTPALPADVSFTGLRGDGYWSSTTSVYEPDWAWALYLDKGAIGVGQKRGAYFYAWAVRHVGWRLWHRVTARS